MKHTSLYLAPMLALLLPLAACNQTTETSAAPETADAAAPAGSSPSADAEAAAASAAASEGAEASTPADATPADATSSEAAAQQPAPAADDTTAMAASGLVEGTDYEVIQGGQPYQPLNGKVEVVEVFGYVCPACARFEPLVTAWEKKLPADVRFTYVPAPFGPQWIPYAKAFYVAETQGLVGKTHAAIFHAIHLEQTLPGEGKTPDEQAIADFYGKYGADPKAFLSAMNSFATQAKVNRGKQFMMRSNVGGTPSIVVDGKYLVKGKSYEDMLQITDKLIAQERAAQ